MSFLTPLIVFELLVGQNEQFQDLTFGFGTLSRLNNKLIYRKIINRPIDNKMIVSL